MMKDGEAPAVDRGAEELNMARTIGKPSVSLATMRENARAQADAFATLHKAAKRHAATLAEMDPERYHPDFLRTRTEELRGEIESTVGPTLKLIREREAEAAKASEAWSPARRRLEASLAAPSEAAALTARLATVGANDLQRLAGEAVAAGDWLLADAIHNQLSRFSASHPGEIELAHDIEVTLDGVDREAREEVASLAAQIGQHWVQAEIVAGHAQGKPLSTSEQMAIVFKYPNSPTPV